MLFFRVCFVVLSTFLFISCSSDDKTTQLIEEQRDSGAFVRTLNFNNSDLILNDVSSTFSVNLEVQDEDMVLIKIIDSQIQNVFV